jgi:hypothetical protein
LKNFSETQSELENMFNEIVVIFTKRLLESFSAHNLSLSLHDLDQSLSQLEINFCRIKRKFEVSFKIMLESLSHKQIYSDLVKIGSQIAKELSQEIVFKKPVSRF